MLRLIFALILAAIALPAVAQDAATSISHVRNNGYRSAAITPNDTVSFQPTSAIFTSGSSGGTACSLTMRLNGDTADVVWANVQPGQLLPVQARLIKSSGTTCSGIIGIYDGP